MPGGAVISGVTLFAERTGGRRFGRKCGALKMLLSPLPLPPEKILLERSDEDDSGRVGLAWSFDVI